MNRQFFIIIAMLFFNFQLIAGFYVENEPGGSSPEDWNDPSTWSPQGIPGAGDTVLIQYDTIHIPNLTSVGYLILQGGAIKADTNLTVINRFDFSGGVIRGKNNVIVMGKCNIFGGMKTLQSKLILYGKTIWNNGDLQLQYNPDDGGQANPCEGGEIYLMADTMQTTWSNTSLPLYLHAIPECCVRLKGECVFIKNGPGALILDGGDVGIQADTSVAKIKIEEGSQNDGCGPIESNCQGTGETYPGGGGGPGGSPGQDCDNNENIDTPAAKRIQKGHIEIGSSGSYLCKYAYQFVEGSSISGGGKMHVKSGYIDYRSSIPWSVDSLNILKGSIVKGNGTITSARIGIDDATMTDSLTIQCKYLTLNKAYLTGNGQATVDSNMILNGTTGITLNRTVILKKKGDWNTSKLSFAQKGKIIVEPDAKLSINTNGTTFEYRHGAGPVVKVLGTLELKGTNGNLYYKVASGETGGGYINVGIGGSAKGCIDCDFGFGGGGGNCFTCPPGDDEPDDGIVTDCGVTLPATEIINEIKGTIETFPSGNLMVDVGFTKFGTNSVIQGDGLVQLKGNALLFLENSSLTTNVETIEKATLLLKSTSNLINNNIALNSSNARIILKSPCQIKDLNISNGELKADSNVYANNITISRGKLNGAGNITASGTMKISNVAHLEGTGALSSEDTLLISDQGGFPGQDSLIIAKPILVNGTMMIQHNPNLAHGIFFKKNGGLITVPAGKELILSAPGTPSVSTSDFAIQTDSMYNPFIIYGTLRKTGGKRTRMYGSGVLIKDGGLVKVEEGTLKWGGMATHGNGSIIVDHGAELDIVSQQTSINFPAPHTQIFPPDFSITGDGIFSIGIDSKVQLQNGAGIVNVDSVIVGRDVGSKATFVSDRRINIGTLTTDFKGNITLNDSSFFNNLVLKGSSDSLMGHGHIQSKIFSYNSGVLQGNGKVQVDSLITMNTNLGRELNKILLLNGEAQWYSGAINGTGTFQLNNGSTFKANNNSYSYFCSANLKLNPGATLLKDSIGTSSFRGHSELNGNIHLPSNGHIIEFYGDTSRWSGANVSGDGTLELDGGHQANFVGLNNMGNSLLNQLSNSVVNDSIGNTFGRYNLNNSLAIFNGYANAQFNGEVNISGGTIKGNASEFRLMKPSSITNTFTLGDGKNIVVDSILNWNAGTINKLAGAAQEHITILAGDEFNSGHTLNQTCNVKINLLGTWNKYNNNVNIFANNANSYFAIDGGQVNITGGKIQLGSGPHSLISGTLALSSDTELYHNPGSSTNVLLWNTGMNTSGSGTLNLGGYNTLQNGASITSNLKILPVSGTPVVISETTLHPKTLTINGTNAHFINNNKCNAQNLVFTGGTMSGSDTISIAKTASLSSATNTSPIRLGTVMVIDSFATIGDYSTILNKSVSETGKLLTGVNATIDITPSASLSSIEPAIENHGTIVKNGTNKVTQLKGRLINYGTIHTYLNSSTSADANRLELINGLENTLYSGSMIKGDGLFKVSNKSAAEHTTVVIGTNQ
jgi:hypothetical protein